MTFDFDKNVSRKGTHSIKWAFTFAGGNLSERSQTDIDDTDKPLLPMWVADMDFRCPPAVTEALAKHAEHGIFGYSYPTESYFQTVIDWVNRRYDWTLERDWIVLTPGVVPAVSMLIQACTKPGEKVLIQPPVYYPFAQVIESNDRVVVSNPLIDQNNQYRMDFADLAQKVADPEVTMAILCNPHNPVGRVWTAEELTQFGEICLANDVFVISDEIHCDLIYKDYTFTSFAKLGEHFRQNSAICLAASKTFNLAGLQTSNIIIPNEVHREHLTQAMRRSAVFTVNTFGPIATEAAYRYGEAWLEAVIAYIEANYHFMKDYLAKHIPQLKVIQPEGTYLVWVDCRALEMTSEDRKVMMMEQAKVYLDEGELFGVEGEGFERFNIACPRSMLKEVLDRIRDTVNQ
ncbi:MAG: MalY/PatB family protein [Chloroflexota bacterium]